MYHPIQLIADKVTKCDNQGTPDAGAQQVPGEETPKGHSRCASHRSRHEACAHQKPSQEHRAVAVGLKEGLQVLVASPQKWELCRQSLEELLPTRTSNEKAAAVPRDRAQDCHHVQSAEVEILAPG